MSKFNLECPDCPNSNVFYAQGEVYLNKRMQVTGHDYNSISVKIHCSTCNSIAKKSLSKEIASVDEPTSNRAELLIEERMEDCNKNIALADTMGWHAYKSTHKFLLDSLGSLLEKIRLGS